MYRSIDEFVEDWSREEEATLKVLKVLTDQSLKQAVSDTQPRTLGDLGWHLVGALGAILGSTGLQFEGPDYKHPTPSNASHIVESYRVMSSAVVDALKQQWTDTQLSENLLLFGSMNMTYGGVLNMVIRHQIHHRGQMTILIRQAGLVPPGVYGPNEEEGAAMRAARNQK
ncbi:hypothetical protein Back11_56470 [Paenibacillus baekrokdamisoli]|uniref:Uncharacterized protein n=1 Tax=Paenibacillus baekrokdamisoli TaxID=1712516 RepID=A0A3G9J176_9BACL|nr:DinB family protein [Paenibacillus baekrokdamisoli]MBB3073190.1 putative damage-inducible protein DinB [Paenibacillus baekrokdamisoli]BBH24302.1 hypothetical protein Back11_56470 [Paenibacillus baekrokdamisoli]